MKYQKTFCSQCGGEFGAGDAGFSSCSDHRFIKLKMPTYYIAKHSDEDLQAAVALERQQCAHHYLKLMRDAASEARFKEREACLKILSDYGQSNALIKCADLIRQRGNHEPWGTSDMAHRTGGLSMDQESVALRLADALDQLYKTPPSVTEAALELRRLHQSESEGWRWAKECEAEVKRLKALIKEQA